MDEIRKRQCARLSELFQELSKGNKFYGRKFDRKLFEQPMDDLTGVLSSLPFTSKQELVDDQLAHPPYGTNLTYPLETYNRFSQTSATTGTPLRWLDTPRSWEWMVDNWRVVFEAAGVGPGDRVYFAFSFGPFIGFWLAFEAAAKMGCLSLPGGGLASAARLRAMLDNAATVLCCTPTYALRLAEAAREERIDLSGSRVRVIIVAGEPGGSVPATRARIESLWPGARVFDHHGMTEVGPVTFECPRRTGWLHVIESAYVAEVIDPETAEPSEPGQSGELVLTTLGRLGSPAIRYRTGDLVRREPPGQCACGRYDMALEGGILARLDDMITIRGVNVYPSAVEEVVRGINGVAEYRVEVSKRRTMDELRIQIEPASGCEDAPGLARRLETALAAAFMLRVPVTLADAGSLPRFEMKARRWTWAEDS